MPQIIVTAGHTPRDEASVMFRERINASDFESERFAENLVERLGWAVDDATEAERAEQDDESTPERDDEPVQERKQAARRPISGDRKRKQEPHLEPVGSA